MPEPAAQIWDITVLIIVATAGVTAILALLMGVILTAGSFNPSRGSRLGWASVMFAIVASDCLVLWVLSDAWGNDEPAAAALGAMGFGTVAFICRRLSHRQHVAVEAERDPKDPHDESEDADDR